MNCINTHRISRRTLLRRTACIALGLGVGLVSRPRGIAFAAETITSTWTIASGAAQLEIGFDESVGRLGLSSVSGPDLTWLGGGGLAPMLMLEGVQVGDGPVVSIDGTQGLRLVERSGGSLECVHEATGLGLVLEFATEQGNAIVNRLTLTNTRAESVIRVARAATLAWSLTAGDWLETLAADDAPAQWQMLEQSLPVSLGYDGLRNGAGGVYPLATLATRDGAGLTIAVDTATAWRIEVDTLGEERRVRAGEFRTDVVLQPGEQVTLPDVVTLFHTDSSAGARHALHAYLASTSAAVPSSWGVGCPTLFNTWFAYGTDLFDDGTEDSPLRIVARLAAAAGLEVLVIDAGWYLGNPPPLRAGLTDEVWADDFSSGLGSWIESPLKWQARPGDGGSDAAGLRNFSDFVHRLEVHRPDGVTQSMKLGLWFEPERFDPALDVPERMPTDWAIPTAPMVDFSRPDVARSMSLRIQDAVSRYRVDYVKIDANADLQSDALTQRSGHFWTRYSLGFEQFLLSLRESNPDVYIEHCAAGLKRFWLGMPRAAHSTWLDDHISDDTVETVLDATDALLLARQKTVLVKEDLSSASGADIADLVRTYAGGEHRNGGALGVSSRIERLGLQQRRTLTESLDWWKSEVRQTR